MISIFKFCFLFLFFGLHIVNAFQPVTNGDSNEKTLNVNDIETNSLIDTNSEQNISQANGDVEKLDSFIHIGIDPDIVQDAQLTTPQLITKYGYPAEVHTVTTSDGYILELHRIPGAPNSPLKQGKQPILLMHDLLDSSATWVIMRPTHGLAYLLADEGYDIWMGNARGNRYSKRHVTLNPEGRKKFWEFSWHEIGVYDLPAMIDYILMETQTSKLHYVGHGQGTTAFFVMCSERPEYNDKIILMNALAPVAYTEHVKSPVLRAFIPFVNSLERTTSLLGLYEFLPSSELFTLGGIDACRDKAFTQTICENILFLIAGYNIEQLNHTTLPVIFGHVPAGASTDQLIHFGQESRSGHFRQFDHGYIGNLRRYNSLNPPDYNLTNVRTKVAIHYSANDWLADVKDVKRLAQGLPNVVGNYLVPDKLFNHIDFVWAIDARSLLYNKVIQLINLAAL